MIDNIKMPPTNFNLGGGLKPSSEVVKSIDVSQHSIKREVSEEEKLTGEDTKQLVVELNNISESLNTDIKFGYDDDLAEVYVTVTDKHTGQVIRKLPTEEAMKIKKSMKELVGSLFDKKV